MAVYLFTFLWVFFLTQGLPMGEPDDWNLIFKSKDTAGTELLKNLSLPWSKSKYWFNQIDGVDQIHHKRIVNGIILKSIEAVFGCRFLPFYLFAKAIFFAGVVALFFLFAYSVTTSIPFALGGTLFFLLVPAHYSHVMWVADPITIAQFFVALGVWIFLHLTLNIDQNRSMKEFLFLLCSFLVVGILGIKTKEPALILPMIAGAYSLIRLRTWKMRLMKVFLLGVVIALLAFQIVPIEHLGATGQAFAFNRDNFVRMLFKNHHCGYEDEPVSAFFSLQRIWPVSIARTFGFFPLWTLMFLFALHWVMKVRRNRDSLAGFLGHQMVVISLLWAGIDIALFGVFQPEPRFLSGTFVPLTLLAARLLWCVYRNTAKPWKSLVVMVAVLAAGWTTIYNNLYSVLALRANIGKRNNRFVNVAKLIYEDQFPGKSPTMRELALFYCPSALYLSPQRPRMEDVTYYTELPRENWSKTRTPSLEDFARSAQRGALYWVTFTKEGLAGASNVTHLATVSGINQGSISEYLILTKFSVPEPLYIFKYVPR